jgi:hypothetical protein
MRGRAFDVELESFLPATSPIRRTAVPVAEVSTLLRPLRNAERTAMMVGRRGGDDLHVWINGDRARVRLDQHREWYATEQRSQDGPEIEFEEAPGETFVEPFAATVSREQAWAAIDHFLAVEQPLPALVWQ